MTKTVNPKLYIVEMIQPLKHLLAWTMFCSITICASQGKKHCPLTDHKTEDISVKEDVKKEDM